ncbi:GNAT family N-acetyltransferase [Modestobacter sp. DSM 44400]|uniref:GNAT family N-acetyltransferase n=1 Tax=Modestobacter sp. DSM 44400 TaxID=1550230 RepID=UPI001C31BAD6
MEIGRLTVVPDRQGQGLGSQLLIAVEGRLPPTVRELRLFTGEHSEANLRLYARSVTARRAASQRRRATP